MNENVVLKILAKIDRDPAISQKRLAEEIGISVGMINWHVKRCTSKGLIKLQQAPMRRYLYYLTPAGFAEKAELTSQYLQASFNIFRTGREQYSDLFVKCQTNQWSNIALLGKSELTELARMVGSGQNGIHINLEIDPSTFDEGGASLPATEIDAVIVTHFFTRNQSLQHSTAILSQMNLDPERLLVPEFLL